MSNRNRQEWGCLHWFLLGFAIFAVAIILLVMLASPSKDGGSSPCQSMTSGRGEVALTDYSGNSMVEGISPVFFGKGSVTVAGAKPPAPAPKPAPVKPAPVKPNLTKQGPAKTAKPAPQPSKASPGASKKAKHKVDLPDCD